MAEENTKEILEAAVVRLEVPSLVECLGLSGTDSDRDSEVETDGKSSAQESDEFEEPSEELIGKIVQQCEFYFSNANILKDQFLLKHVRRNKEGWVSLKLVSCFRRMKRLSKDYRQVMVALRRSSTSLEVSEDGSKVRRKDPLPSWDETVFSRTVVISNFPISQQNSVSFEWVNQQVKPYGEPVLVRFVKPQKEIPGDLKPHVNRHGELGQKLCAVVEFENHASADQVCQAFNKNNDVSGNWRSSGLCARLLKPPRSDSGSATPNSQKTSRHRNDSDSSSPISIPHSGSSPRNSPYANRSPRNSPHPNRSPVGSPRNSSPHVGRSPIGSPSVNRSPVGSPYPSRSPKTSRAGQLGTNHLSTGRSSQTPPQGSPWSSPSLRRKALTNVSGGAVTYVAVCRQPLGPDGTAGFRCH